MRVSGGRQTVQREIRVRRDHGEDGSGNAVARAPGGRHGQHDKSRWRAVDDVMRVVNDGNQEWVADDGWRMMMACDKKDVRGGGGGAIISAYQ